MRRVALLLPLCLVAVLVGSTALGGERVLPPPRMPVPLGPEPPEPVDQLVLPDSSITFGGTAWDAADGRWEAIPGGTWTFDSGVGSHFQHPDTCKDASLHAFMEGWSSFDGRTPAPTSQFRRLSTADFALSPATCVGSTGALFGDYSYWCGLLPDEAAALSWCGGQGYGNRWNICLGKEFAYDGTDTLRLSYDYRCEMENGWDYVSVFVDTACAGDGSADIEAAYHDDISVGYNVVNLRKNQQLPSQAGCIKIKFCVITDYTDSDEDGRFPTNCGAFGVDNIFVGNTAYGGGIYDYSTFETGTDGWEACNPTPCGRQRDLADIKSLVDLPTIPPALGDCAVSDSVLVFFDPSTGEHPFWQNGFVMSPWIDLRGTGYQGAPNKYMDFDFYADLPMTDWIVMGFLTQWDPDTSDTGGECLSEMAWAGSGFLGADVEPKCTTTGAGRQRIDLSEVLEPQAEVFRIGVRVLNLCFQQIGSCTFSSNETPWIDNIQVGLFWPGTIQEAVDLADEGDTVFVPAGTYTGLGNRDIDFGGKNVVVYAPDGPAATIIDCEGLDRAFVFNEDEDTTSVVEGFTIRNGDAGEILFFEQPGGAILVTSSSAAKIVDCVFESNHAGKGGAITVDENSYAVIRGCWFEDNDADDGGALGVISGAEALVEDCDFYFNEAPEGDGGAVRTYLGTLTMRRCTIDGSIATNGGGMYLRGPGLIEDTEILGNLAHDEGGGVACYRTDFSTCGDLPVFRNCTIWANTASDRGGGVGVECFVLEDCTVSANLTTGDGGGVFAGRTGTMVEASHMTGCTITGNDARAGGGAVAIGDRGYAGAELQLTACTVSANHSGNGGGFHLSAGGTLNARRVLLWGNCADTSGAEALLADAAAALVFTCSAVDSGSVEGPGMVTYSGTQVFTDPLLCGPASCWNTPDPSGDYTLAANSPCLPASSPCDTLIGAWGEGCAATIGVEPHLPPGQIALRAFPNPFRRSVTLAYSAPETALGEITIFDVSGRLVRVFDCGDRRQGAIHWDGRDDGGGRVPPGVYFVRLGDGDDGPTERVVLLP